MNDDDNNDYPHNTTIFQRKDHDLTIVNKTLAYLPILYVTRGVQNVNTITSSMIVKNNNYTKEENVTEQTKASYIAVKDQPI